MSSIKKLTIQGIRSFGQEKSDEQSVTFTTPLTLVVGENGCGKTTIIESLKAALTGEYPPGTEKGRTFLNDPVISGRNSTNAKISLKVTDVSGDTKTVVRSYRFESLKNGKSKFETRDSTIIYEDAAGNKKEQHGKKIEETNAEMIHTMGVSKAVLNNVLFCHQEDSNWPLDEAKKLKIKFDEIFGTTEYNKSVDKLGKIVKDMEAKLKLSKQNMDNLEQYKKDQEKKAAALDNLNQKRAKISEDVEIREKIIDEVSNKMKEYLMKEKHFSDIINERKTLKSDISRLEEQIAKTQSNIKELLNEDAETIEGKIEKFSELLKNQENQKQKLMTEIDKLNVREMQKMKDINANKTQIELIANKIGEMQDKMDKRIEDMKKIAEKMNLNLSVDLDTQSLNDSGLNEALNQIRNAIKGEEKVYDACVKEELEKENEIQKKIDKTRTEKTEIETNLKSLEKQVKDNENKKVTLKQQIKSIESSMPALKRLESEIKKTQEDLEKVKNENDLTELEDNKALLDCEKDILDTKITELDSQLEKLEKIHQLKSEIDQKEKEIAKDQSDFDRTKNKQSSAFKNLFPSQVIKDKFKENVQEIQSKLQRSVDKCNEDIVEKNKSLDRLKNKLEHDKKESQKKSDELRIIKSKIEDLCGSKNYIEVLHSTKEKVDKLKMEHAFLKSSENSFNHYIAEIKEEPCCPLCHKDLQSNDKDELKSELEDKIRQLPEKLSATMKKLNREDEKFNKLNSLKSSYDSVEKYEKDIEMIKSQIESNQKLESTLSEQIEDLEMEISEPKSKLEIISTSFLFDMSKLDDLLRRIVQKTDEVEKLKQKLPADMPNKSLDEMRNEKRKFNAEMKTKNEEINALSKKISDSQKKIHNLQDQLNSMITKKASLQERVQGLDQMRKQVEETEALKLQLLKQKEENDAKVDPIKEKLDQLIQEKEKFKLAAAENVAKMQKKINNLNINHKEINQLSYQIKSYEQQNLPEKIESLKSEIAQQETAVETYKTEKLEKEKKIQDIQKDLANQDGKLRNLKDNLDLLKDQSKMQLAEEKLKVNRDKYGNIDVSKMQEEKCELQKKYDETKGEQSKSKGLIHGLDNQIRTSEEELSEDRYKNANRYFLKAGYNVHYLKAAIADLRTYNRALERAVIKFHQDKMDQINQTIREYWNRIYRGNDIDYIMIKTSNDDEENPPKKDDKKRSYSYRVVQAKNGGAEIDMRGRCSAGQKVLASLIIRMALADTFSLNCGILTLDEPTTNLDHNNIMSLCQALVQIIEEREKFNPGFMLIIITHDMEFIKSMERAESYYHLSRDHRGLSKIERIDNM